MDRLDRQRQITVSANPAQGVSQAEAEQIVRQVFAQMQMDPGYALVTSGQSKELSRATRAFGFAFALSFAFMYMVLAAQFESFIHPVTILLTLPLAVPFGLLSSLLFGQALNIYSALGVLLLFGIVKKNAILQIDHTIGLCAHGLSRGRRHHRGQSRSAAADSHDDAGAGRRMIPPSSAAVRRANQPVDRPVGRRRPVAVPGPHAAGRAGVLLALRGRRGFFHLAASR